MKEYLHLPVCLQTEVPKVKTWFTLVAVLIIMAMIYLVKNMMEKQTLLPVQTPLTNRYLPVVIFRIKLNIEILSLMWACVMITLMLITSSLLIPKDPKKHLTRMRDIYQGWYLTANNLGGGFFIPAPVGFNVRPTRTTQYELGFTQQIGDFASFDITGYYKDIQDQVVYRQQSVTNSRYGAYAILTNGDFATTKGLEISFNMRRQARFMLNGSISFQDAQGTGSFPNSNRGIVGAPLDGVTRFAPQYIAPLEFNNSVRGNINLDYRFSKDDGGPILEELGISALLSFNSGHPYTTGIA